jgi:hypothetical protein
MAVTSPLAPDVAAPLRRRPVLALVVAALCAVPYAVGLVLPYYAAGLQGRPAGEPLYRYDLTTLFPYDTALGGVVAFIAIVGMPTAPFVTVAVAMWSGFSVWDAWRTLTKGQVVLYLAAIVVAVGSLVWLATPLASELIIWFLD